MGIRALDPHEASLGPVNANRKAVMRMLRNHGFEIMPNTGDGQHQLLQHHTYRKITTKVTGHTDHSLKAATVAQAGQACLDVLKLQQAEREKIADSVLAGMPQDEATEMIRGYGATLERTERGRFILRDTIYPELGVMMKDGTPKADVKDTLRRLRHQHGEHEKMLIGLMDQGYDVIADGIHPTRIVHDDYGLPERELPIFDGKQQSASKLAYHLAEAQKQGRQIGERIDTLMNNIAFLQLELKVSEQDGVRRLELRDAAKDGFDQILRRLLKGYQELKPSQIKGPLKEHHLLLKKIFGNPAEALARMQEQSPFFAADEKTDHPVMSEKTLSKLEETLSQLFTRDSMLLQDMLETSGNYTRFKSFDGTRGHHSSTTGLSYTLPPDATQYDKYQTKRKFITDDVKLRSAQFKIDSDMQAGGLVFESVRQGDKTITLIKTPGVTANQPAYGVEGTLDPLVTLQRIGMQAHALNNFVPVWLSRVLGDKGFTFDRHEGGQEIWKNDSNGESMTLPHYQCGKVPLAGVIKTITAHEKNIPILKRNNCIEGLIADYGYSRGERALIPPAGLHSGLGQIPLADDTHPKAVALCDRKLDAACQSLEQQAARQQALIERIVQNGGSFDIEVNGSRTAHIVPKEGGAQWIFPVFGAKNLLRQADLKSLDRSLDADRGGSYAERTKTNRSENRGVAD